MDSVWTRKNVNIVREQISQKIGRQPFLPSGQAVNLSVTDQDTFPYPRYYRGVYGMSEPVIYEREAGWRQRHDECYEPTRVSNMSVPQYCWQNACSTVLPCKKNNFAAQQTDCVIIST